MDRVGRADVVGVNNPHETKVFQVATDKEVGHAFCPAGKTWIPPNVRLWPKADIGMIFVNPLSSPEI